MTLGKGGVPFEKRQPTLAVAFLPGDKELLSFGTDATLRRWDLKTEKAKEIVLEHSDRANAAVVSPDSKTIATGDLKGVVRLWDVTGKLLATFDEHTEGITELAFNHDGTLLASGSLDQLIKVWKIPQKDRK